MATNRKHQPARKNSQGRKVRYAVVGLGYIAQVAVLPAFQHAQANSELVALFSGDKVKRKTLARKYKVQKTYSYEEYADCLGRKEVDAVYIALPNNMHRAYAEGAAMAGVHVLCEKPMAMDEAECQAMIAAAAQGNVKLMTAYRLHFEKGNLSAIQAIRRNQIGEPRIFRSAFCQQAAAGNYRLSADLGGGPLYDIGIYCLNAARYLFRAEPDEAFAYSVSGKDRRFAEVPEMTAALLRFPGDRLASFTCSFGAADRSSYEVIGSKGVLKMDPAYEMVGSLRCEITVGEKTRAATYSQRDQFGPELVYFSDCILKNREPEPGGKEGLADVRIIRALVESSRKGQPMRLSPVAVGKRPDVEQEIDKPAVKKPALVRAASPSR
jgi:predicted dehydrogenase